VCAGDGSASTPAGGGRRLGPELRVSRRGFLLGIGAAGGAAALGGIGYAVDQWVGGSPPPWPAGTVAAFRSRPDLRPPVVTVTVPADSTAPGSIFLAPSAGAGQFGPLIVDDRGEPIWFHPISGPWPAGTPGLGKPVATNFRAGVYRGRPVLAGTDRVGMRPVARARRQGFETEIATRHLAPGDRAVAVAALDRGGRVLARSGTRPI